MIHEWLFIENSPLLFGVRSIILENHSVLGVTFRAAGAHHTKDGAYTRAIFETTT